MLSGSAVASCQVTGALAWEVENGGAVDVFVAFGTTTEAALETLDEARSRGSDALFAEAEAEATNWLAAARLPATDDPDVLGFAERALLAIHVGTDRETDAIVASITTQPPYAQDWPRDSAFFDAALDLAGYSDQVTRHKRFLASVQATQEDGLTPAGAWYRLVDLAGRGVAL